MNGCVEGITLSSIFHSIWTPFIHVSCTLYLVPYIQYALRHVFTKVADENYFSLYSPFNIIPHYEPINKSNQLNKRDKEIRVADAHINIHYRMPLRLKCYRRTNNIRFFRNSLSRCRMNLGCLLCAGNGKKLLFLIIIPNTDERWM